MPGISIDEMPWNIPVPIRPANFSSLFETHQCFNIKTDLAAIGSFGAQEDFKAPETLLFADQQSNLFLHASGRLGSGRAGFYKGSYLKGIGRTPLAANWNIGDTAHSTGHMSASSAIREYFVSLYANAVQARHTIVPCEGVLLQDLDKELHVLRDMLPRHFLPETLPAADNYLQSITIKGGEFLRLGNFTWFLQHLVPQCVQGGRNGLSRFCLLLSQSLSAPGYPAENSSDISPSYLVDKLEKAIIRTCEYFRVWQESGIWWGSFGNNFAMDGRFLDLEIPSISCGPLLGILSSAGVIKGKTWTSAVIGAEIFSYLIQMQRFCALCVRVLSHLPPLFSSVERDFAQMLAEEVKTRLMRKDWILNSRSHAIDAALEVHRRSVQGLSKRSVSKLRDILGRSYDRFSGASAYVEPAENDEQEETVPLDCASIISERGVKWRFHALKLEDSEMICPSREELERSRYLNGLIMGLDSIRCREQLLDELRGTGEKIENIFSNSRVREVQCRRTSEGRAPASPQVFELSLS